MKVLSKRLAEAPVSATARIDEAAKRLAAEGADVISFCVGEPDFDTPIVACDAGIAAITAGRTHYTPVSGVATLKETVRKAHQETFGVSYAEDEIIITPGAKFAIYAAVQTLVDPGDEVLLPAPYWTSYREMIRLAGGTAVPIPCEASEGFHLPLARLKSAVTPRTKMLILNNPNNPSGAVYGAAELAEVAAFCRDSDLYVISDEIYASLIYDDARFVSYASLSEDAKRRSITVNGASKAFAMTGWRIGYAAGDRTILRAMTALMSHSSGCASAIGQEAAIAAYSGAQSDLVRMRTVFSQRRDQMLLLLNQIDGVSCRPPEGAFYVLLDVRRFLHTGEADTEFALRLLEQAGVAVVPCTEFGLPGFVRLAYTQEEAQTQEGIRRLQTFCSGRQRKETL